MSESCTDAVCPDVWAHVGAGSGEKGVFVQAGKHHVRLHRWMGSSVLAISLDWRAGHHPLSKLLQPCQWSERKHFEELYCQWLDRNKPSCRCVQLWLRPKYHRGWKHGWIPGLCENWIHHWSHCVSYIPHYRHHHPVLFQKTALHKELHPYSPVHVLYTEGCGCNNEGCCPVWGGGTWWLPQWICGLQGCGGFLPVRRHSQFLLVTGGGSVSARSPGCVLLLWEEVLLVVHSHWMGSSGCLHYNLEHHKSLFTWYWMLGFYWRWSVVDYKNPYVDNDTDELYSLHLYHTDTSSENQFPGYWEKWITPVLETCKINSTFDSLVWNKLHNLCLYASSHRVLCASGVWLDPGVFPGILCRCPVLFSKWRGSVWD